MKKIIIKHTRGIKKLEFTLPDKAGLYLLVAPNGSGKSTLLTVLDRICNKLAFSQMFKVPTSNADIDLYSNSQIVYDVGTMAPVTFSKGNQRWVSKPKNNESILKAFGYTCSYFVKADPNRIAVKQDEMHKVKPCSANQAIIDGMNNLFSTQKYKKLIQYKAANSRGKGGNYFYAIKDVDGTYSEKRFSTGELAILRLLETLMKIDNGSLLLLDEAELALHPKVQLKLLSYLGSICKEKDITAIIATHSPAMIQNISPSHIIMLDDQGEGEYEVVNPCYPARALGEVYGKDLTPPDAIYYVEDEMACYILDEVFKQAKKINFLVDRIDNCKRQIYPVGSYTATTQLANNVKNSWISSLKIHAVVDHDVYEHAEQERKSPNKHQYIDFIERYKEVIFDLGCTPEVALIEQIEKNNTKLIKDIDNEYACDLSTFIASDSYLNNNNNNVNKQASQIAKKKFEKIVQYLQTKSPYQCDRTIKQKLVQFCVPMIYNESQIKNMVGRLLP